MILRAQYHHDRPLYKALDHVRQSRTKLMGAVFNYLHNNKVDLTWEPPRGNAPFSIREQDGHPLITIYMTDKTPRTTIAMHVAMAAKHLAQRDMNKDVFIWDQMGHDARASQAEKGQNYLRSSYKLTPIVDAVLVQIIASIDAHAFGHMVMHELGSSTPDQALNAAYHNSLLAVEKPAINSIRSEFNRLTQVLADVEKAHKLQGTKKPAAKISPVTMDQVKNLCSNLWWAESRLQSPFTIEPSATELVDYMRHQIEMAGANDIRIQAKRQLRLPGKPEILARRILALSAKPRI